jgi:regulator of protease activity HflC (stomatin/prohibitin superfamily)
MTKIYISSTYSDLIEHRQQVYDILRKMRCDVIAMEDYVATDERPLDKCLADVASCDVYVGIFAWRYGYIPPGQERSVTELEYRKAGEVDIPRLIFLLDEDAPWPSSKMEKGAGRAKIEALRDELRAARLVQVFKSPDDLALNVAAAIARWKQTSLNADMDFQDFQLGIDGRVELVEDGKSSVLRAAGREGVQPAVPGLLIVADGHAVVLERGRRISRIVGAGTTFLRQDEQPGLIVPLRSETISKVITNVLTRDGVMIEAFTLFVYYQVDPGSSQSSEGIEFAYNEDHIKRIWRRVNKDWDSIKPAMETIVDTSLRDVITRCNLDEVFTARERIKDEVCAQINKRSLDFLAIRVVGADIGEVRIPEEVKDRLMQKWMADWDQRIDTTRAETEKLVQMVEATARKETIQAIAEGITQALRQLVGEDAKPEDLIALRYIEYLEKTGGGEEGWPTQERLEAIRALGRLGIRRDEEEIQEE